MHSELHEIKKTQATREIVFMTLAIIVALTGAVAAAFLKDGSRLAAVESILLILFLALLFSRFRASNCANAIGIVLYLENTNVKAAHQILRLSDCIKNADAIVGMLAKLGGSRKPTNK